MCNILKMASGCWPNISGTLRRLCGMHRLKYAAFLPYVNAVRLLSIKEGIFETSTLGRMEKLKQLDDYSMMLRHSEEDFINLLKYRLSLSKAENYADTHYLKVEQLSKHERKELKQILKDGKQFHEQVLAYIKRVLNMAFEPFMQIFEE